MKKHFISICLLFIIPFYSFAQSPSSFFRTGPKNRVQVKIPVISKEDSSNFAAPAPNNPWMVAGVQAGYAINGGSFEKNFQPSGRVILETFPQIGKRTNLFLMGNLSDLTSQNEASNSQKIKELQQSNQGINIGFYPHMKLGKLKKNKDFESTFYFPISYKVNAFENIDQSETTIYLNQLRISAGIEFAGLVGKGADLPCTLSIEPCLTTIFEKEKYKNIFGEEKSLLPSIETTLIVPAGPGRGILLVYSTSSENTSQFMIGVILVGSRTK